MITPNELQQFCIDNIEGQYLVLAGPGTGKTFTVVRRIKNIIKKGINPEKILCLTFSDAAANEMKTRIDDELETSDSKILVSTYHSFCKNIIDDNSDEFELEDNTRLINEAVSKLFLKDCIDEINPINYRISKKKPYSCLKEIKNAILAIKQNRINKEQFFHNLENNKNWIPYLKELENKKNEAINKGKNPAKTLMADIEKTKLNIEKMKELWRIYECYSRKMAENRYIDFSDMINFVLDKFESDSKFLDEISNKYDYILVDEYQDTNAAQNAIVFNLVHGQKKKNVFVVGDDDQIIFSFQGARLDTMEKFLSEFPETKVVCLTENMRSTQNILDIARKIALQDDNRLEKNEKFEKYNINKNLIAKNPEIIEKNKPVRLYKYADSIQECQEIVKEIDELINSSDCPKDKNGNKNLSEIAILSRSNFELETFASMLKDKNIPFELKEGKSIFSIKSSLMLYYYLSVLVNPNLYSDRLYKLMLLKPFQINPRDYETLLYYKSLNKSFIDSFLEFDEEKFIEKDKIKNFIETFSYLREFKDRESLKDTILEIGSKTGIFDFYLNNEINKSENISGLKKLIDEAIDFSSLNRTLILDDFVQYLDIVLEDEELEIKTDKAPLAQNAVQLSTYHSSKGREFEYVYMPSLFNTKWESKRFEKPPVPLDPKEAKTEEEYKNQKISDCIRVMFVGLTRAKHTLRLSYHQGGGTRTKLTQFISNIEDMFEKEKEPFEYDVNSYWNTLKEAIIKKDYDYKRDFDSLIDSKLKTCKYSPSAINEYLNCKRQYFYDYILDLASSSANPNSLSFGSAIHKSLEMAVKYAIQENKYPTKEFVIEEFKKELNKLPMDSFEQRQFYIERGIKTIDGYYHHLSDTPLKNLFEVEKHIEYNLDGIDFKGFIDRVDKNEDGTYTIYDYKTGSAKTKTNVALNSDYQNYYCQMAFYKYIFEKMTNEKVKETVFVFPEEPEKNLVLNFDNEDCELVMKMYKDAVEEIRNHNFELPDKQYKKEKDPCKYCQYKIYCSLEIIN